MKKVFTIAGSLIMAAILLTANTGISAAPEESNNDSISIYEIGPPAFINDIQVPYEVLQYIHMAYPAHAVVDADRIQIDSKPGYRLTVSRDSEAKEKTYVYFSERWDVVKAEEIFANKQRSAPVEPRPQTPVEQPEPAPAPEEPAAVPQSAPGRPVEDVEPSPDTDEDSEEPSEEEPDEDTEDETNPGNSGE